MYRKLMKIIGTLDTEVSSTRLKSEFLSKLGEKLCNIREISDVVQQPEYRKDIDVSIKILISSPRSIELIRKIADAISEAKWEVFEEMGELPAVEWEIERKLVKSRKERRSYRWTKAIYRYEKRRTQTKRRVSKRQNRRTSLRSPKLNQQEAEQNKRNF